MKSFTPSISFQDLSFDAFAHAILSQYYHGHIPDESQSIYIGSVAVRSFEKEVISLLEQWVQYMDERIDKTRRLSEEYIQLMSQRLFTWEEYQYLFEAQPNEELYTILPVYEFLVITNEESRNGFTYLLKADQKQDYLNSLLAYTHLPIVAYLEKKIPFFIPLKDFERHAYIPGKTGFGKSIMMQNLFYDLQQQTYGKNNQYLAGMALIDPDGDTAKNIRDFQLNRDCHRLIYFDPYYDKEYMPVLNPFELKDKSEQNIDVLSQELAEVLELLMPKTSITVHMEALLIPCIATLLRKGDKSLKDLQRFMLDETNSDLVEAGKRSPNPIHREFFQFSFNHREYSRTKHSIYTKIQRLLGSSIFHKLVTGKSTLDLEAAMEDGKVILFNLSKGSMGLSASEAFGRLLIALIQNIARKRDKITEKLRKPFYLFIDEFQNYTSKSIEMILDGSRKFKLHAILAHQHLAQLENSSLKESILTNMNVRIVGKSSRNTFSTLADEMYLKVEDTKEHIPYHFYVQSNERTPLLVESFDSLVNKKSAYFLNQQEKEALQYYLVQHSGVYQPIQEEILGLNNTFLQDTSPQEEKLPHMGKLGQKEKDTSSKQVLKSSSNKGKSIKKKNQDSPPKPKYPPRK